MYNDKYIKTKIKTSNNKITTSFKDNETSKDNECCACLFVMLLDSDGWIIRFYQMDNQEYYISYCDQDMRLKQV